MTEIRTFGEILTNISIGTAIPFEGLINSTSIKDYNHIYINLLTLHRNFYGSFIDKRIILNKFPYKFYKQEFIEEINTLTSIIDSTVNANLKIVYYITTHLNLDKSFKHNSLKVPTTKNQKEFNQLEINIVDDIIKTLNKNITIWDSSIKGNNTSSLIITHLPLDLLSYGSFRKLSLLESHTGKIKNKLEWITKLTKNNEAVNIPFNIISAQVFGDNNKIHPLSRKIVKLFIELSKENNWNSTTTIPKQQFDIRKLNDKEQKNLLLDLSFSKLI